MTPEQVQINELKAQIDVLQRQMREFTSVPELDPKIKQTITGILSTSSTKTAASGRQAVNESGASSYNVMFPPTGFIKIGIYDVPYI